MPAETTTPAVSGRYAAPVCRGEKPSTFCMYSVRKKNMDRKPATPTSWVTSAAASPLIRNMESGMRGFRTRR
jgi:hypothetical protein